jgi:hypothetical protein
MDKSFAIALLVTGVVMLILGFNASDSVPPDFSRLFTGNPTDKATRLVICGAAAVAAGLFLSGKGSSA